MREHALIFLFLFPLVIVFSIGFFSLLFSCDLIFEFCVFFLIQFLKEKNFFFFFLYFSFFFSVSFLCFFQEGFSQENNFRD